MKRIVLLAAFAVLLTAAKDDGLSRKKYRIADGVTEQATLHFPKGNLHLTIYGDADAQYYGVLDGKTCTKSRMLIIYNAGIGGNTKEKPVAVEAGKPINIIASTLRHHSGWTGVGFSDRWDTCTKIIRFKPEAGKTYQIKQESDVSRASFCSLGLREETSGNAPDGVAALPPLSCLF